MRRILIFSGTLGSKLHGDFLNQSSRRHVNSKVGSSRCVERSSVLPTYTMRRMCGVPAVNCSFAQPRFLSFTSMCWAPQPASSATGGKPQSSSVGGYSGIDKYTPTEEKKEEEDNHEGGGGPDVGYLPFPAPFHTFNIIMFLFLGNILAYLFMTFCDSDDWRDFVVEHCTLSHENAHRIYPFFTNAFYQEQELQLAIDCWLLWQFGNTVLTFLGGKKMAVFWAMTTFGGGMIHIGRQHVELYLGHDPIEVRGRCYGPNPFILGLVAVEGLIFRHLNFIQQPPVPFLVLTAFVMVIDVWRIFTTKPEEHGASTGGALVAYVFWALPARFLGLSKLTATI